MRLATKLALSVLAAVATAAEGQIQLSQRGGSGDPVKGTVRTYPIPGCSDESLMGGGKTWHLAPDDCLKVSSSTSFYIDEPAICANGTRAKLARYEGRNCNYGEVTVKGGLVEVKDDDLDEVCQYVAPDGFRPDRDHGSIASFGFYCDGKKSDEPRSRWASFSLNTCPRGSDPPVSNPTWEHYNPGECHAILYTERLEIAEPATCKDGSQARLAKWYNWNRQCKGDYDEVVDITDEMMKECFFINKEEHSSFKFLCPENDGGVVRMASTVAAWGVAAGWVLWTAAI